MSYSNLEKKIARLASKKPQASQDLIGSYDCGDFELHIDSVPDDPSRNPLRMRVRVGIAGAGFPDTAFSTKSREIAARDFMTRTFNAGAAAQSALSRIRGARIFIDRPGPVILETSAVVVGDGIIEARFTADLPIEGDRIVGNALRELFMKNIPGIVRASLVYDGFDAVKFTATVDTAEDADTLRNMLPEMGLAAFVADGSVPAGKAGIVTRGASKAVQFRAPETLAVTVELPNRGAVRGLGVPAGITVVAGERTSGKTALLTALALGVYNHPPDDGRELIVTAPDAVYVPFEEGRRIENVDISPIIPKGSVGDDMQSFRTEAATPVESQAANIIEALEIGTSLLLFNEDSVAPGFATRDARIQELLSGDEVTLTPLVYILPALRDEMGVSAVIALGGSGDFLDIADTVIVMSGSELTDATEKAAKIVRERPTGRKSIPSATAIQRRDRRPFRTGLEPVKLKKEEKVRPHGSGYVQYGDEFIDLDKVIQLVSSSQARGIARGLSLVRRLMDGSRSLRDAVNEVMKRIDAVGLDTLSNRRMGDLAGFRPHELAAAVNRLKQLKVK